MKPDLRVFTLDRAELRSGGKNAGRVFTGHASVFNELSEELGGFYERVAPTAFDAALDGRNDVRMLINHDPNRILARTKPGTLTLSRDDSGLVTEARLPNTSYAHDLAESLDRGDVDAMSFGFLVVKEQWATEELEIDGETVLARVRTLHEVELFDVSIVVFPAYLQTDAELNQLAYRFLSRRGWQPNPAGLEATEADLAGSELAELVSVPAPVVHVHVHASPVDDVAALKAEAETIRGLLAGKQPRLDERARLTNRLAEVNAQIATAETDVVDMRGELEQTLGEPEDVRSERRYKRSVEFVRSTAWLLHPEALATIKAILAERAAGVRLSDEQIRERLGTSLDDDLDDELFEEAAEEGDEPSVSPVAVISVRGPIVPRGGLFTRVSGMTSVQGLQDELRAALVDETVKAIVLDIDSPGGSAAMIPELAEEIREARGLKPIVAVANHFCASAAYFIASAAGEVVVTPSGQVGSVGAYAAHEDISKLLAEEGVKVTLVSAGKYKVEGNPYEPLTDAAKAEIQRKVDHVYDQFVDAVAQGRGVSRDKVLKDFGQGRMVLPEDAVKVGMVDRIATLDDTVAELVQRFSGEERDQPDAETAFAIERQRLVLFEKD